MRFIRPVVRMERERASRPWCNVAARIGSGKSTPMRTPRTRPLQIRELVAAAVEHLEAASRVGLAKRYLPTGLVATVAGGDYRSLAPFGETIAEELRRAYADLGARDGFALLAPGLDVELADGGGTGVGQPPRFASSFPAGESKASWAPAPSVAARGPELAHAGFVEIVFTASAGGGTARQSRVVVSLAPELPPKLAARAARAESVASQPPLAGAPDPEARWLAAACAEAHRVSLRGGGALLWAPAGAFVVGRVAALAHVVPEEAPANLSSRHLALARGGETGESLVAVDLGSTNGTWIGARRLEAWRPTLFALPATLEIGSEGALRIELSALAAKGLGDSTDRN